MPDSDQDQPKDAPKPNEDPTPGANANDSNSPSPDAAASQAASGSKVDRIEATNSIIVVAGSANLNDLSEAFHSLRQGSAIGGSGDSGDSSVAEIIRREIASAFGALLPGTFSRQAGDNSVSRQRPEKMPDTHEEIEVWFCEQLSDYEQCMVRVTAILHGAPATDINVARQQLYEQIHPNREQQPAELKPASKRIANTYTEVHESNGSRRIYWQDAEKGGYSLFGLKVLRLLACEIEGTAGIPEHNILPLLEKWASSDGDGEHAWRAAHALGVIWWILDQDRLKTTAMRWANSPNPQIRSAAAWMLYGAYEIEHSETDAAHLAFTERPPMTEKLLRQWTTDVLKPNSSAEFAIVVTSVYALIAHKWPDASLNGLDYLLGLSPSDTTVSIQALPTSAFLPAALTYVHVAWIGHTRAVVSRLAEHAERLVRPQSRGILNKAATFEREWQAFRLKRLFFFYFLLVASSFEDDSSQRDTGDQSTEETRYGAEPTLPVSLPIPYAETLDTLLAGIVAPREEIFRSELITLLSAAFYHGNAVQASQTLLVWADTILRQQSAEAPVMRLTYLKFIETLGRKIQDMDAEFGAIRPQEGYAKFEKQLGLWPHKSTVSAFAQSALSRLNVHRHL